MNLYYNDDTHCVPNLLPFIIYPGSTSKSIDQSQDPTLQPLFILTHFQETQYIICHAIYCELLCMSKGAW